MTLSTEHTIDPAVFVLRNTHVIDISGRIYSSFRRVGRSFWHGDGLWPETEVVHSVRTLSYSKERLSVGSLHTDDEHILAIPFHGTSVERGVHHDTLHEEGIILLAEVIAPFQWGMVGSENGIDIFLIDAVAPFSGLVYTA